MTTTKMNSLLPSAWVAGLATLSFVAGDSSSPILKGPMSHEDAISRIRQKRFRILVVDDDDRFRTSMVFKLQDLYDAITVEADTGQTALDAIGKEHAFDLILMDIAMPGKDGIETCKEMRALGINTRVVLMSAHYDADKRARAKALRLKQLNKPVDSDALQLILLECAEEDPHE